MSCSTTLEEKEILSVVVWKWKERRKVALDERPKSSLPYLVHLKFNAGNKRKQIHGWADMERRYIVICKLILYVNFEYACYE